MVQASTTTNKNFKVKNGLDVAGTATFGSTVVLGDTPLRFDTATNKLQLQINGTWMPIALNSEIPDVPTLSFMDIGLSIDYDGSPTYIVQANGVNITGDSTFVSGGEPSDNSPSMVFDSGALA
jgi:hypothetical protein